MAWFKTGFFIAQGRLKHVYVNLNTNYKVMTMALLLQVFSSEVVTIKSKMTTLPRYFSCISLTISLWRSICRVTVISLSSADHKQHNVPSHQRKVTLLCIRRGSSYALGRPRPGRSYQLFVLPEQRTPNTCPSNALEQIHAYVVWSVNRAT